MVDKNLLLIFTLAITIEILAKSSNDFTVGSIDNKTDHIIRSYEVFEPVKWYHIFSKTVFRTFEGDNRTILTAVKVIDQDNNGNGATASIINDGPGSTFVTIEFEGKWRQQINYRVELWGPLRDW